MDCITNSEAETSFPGGLGPMQRFINESTRYPQVSIENGEQGRVYLKFFVEKDGKITRVEVEHGISPLLDGEAIRVLRSMPDWTIGMCNGKPVRTRCRMPIIFTLD